LVLKGEKVMTPNEAAAMTPVFNYGNISDAHKDAAKEIANIIASSGNIMLAEVIKQRFKVVEIPKFNLEDSKFAKACMIAGVFPAVQGHVQEGSDLDKMEYPLVGICEDIRKLEKLYEVIKNSEF